MNHISKIVFYVTDTVERHCIESNTNTFVQLGEEGKKTIIDLLRNSTSASERRCLEKLWDSNTGVATNNVISILDGFGRLGFTEHIFMYRQLAILRGEWFTDSENERLFNESILKMKNWRNDKRGHSKLIESVREDDFNEFLRASRCVSGLIALKLDEQTIEDVQSKTPSNMPEPEYSRSGGKFIGRHKERTNLKQRLRANYVVCVNGRGGLGKTALAQSVISDFIADGDEFDYIVWYSSKTDIMTSDGKQGLRQYDSGYHRFLTNCLRVVDGEDSGADSLDDMDFVIEYLKEAIKSNDKVLFVIDNYETLEDVSGESDYQKFARILEQEDELPFDCKAKWLITSRNVLPFGPNITLERLEDSAAHAFLMQCVRSTDRFPEHFAKKLGNKGYRTTWLKRLYNYPLFIKLFCGWLAKGADIDSVLNASKDMLELEEFCFRNTIDILDENGSSHERGILGLILAANKKGLFDLTKSECRDALELTVEEFDDARTSLMNLSVVQLNENLGLEIAPAMSGYIQRHLKYDGLPISKIEAAIKKLINKRRVEPKSYSVIQGPDYLTELDSALRLWSQLKSPVSRGHSRGFLDFSRSAFKNQLQLNSLLLNEQLEEEKIVTALGKAVSEIEGGYGYWNFNKDVWGRILKIVPPTEVYEYGKALVKNFSELEEPKLNLLVQESYLLRIEGCIEIDLGSVLNRILQMKRVYSHSFNILFWKRSCIRIFKNIASAGSSLNYEHKELVSEIFGYLNGINVVSTDFEWSTELNNYFSRETPQVWSDWLMHCENVAHDQNDFDLYHRWSQLLKMNR